MHPPSCLFAAAFVQWNELGRAITYSLQPWQIVLMLIGTTLGITVGAIPGLTGAMLIALSLPLTFAMESKDALILLVSMYVGSISGGLITATLLRMPGTPASMMTTLDGYPMAQAGQPGRALGLGISASFFGGMVSWLFLLFLSQPMSKLSLMLSKFDFFALVLLALVMIASVAGKSLVRGIIAGLLGMLVALPGLDPFTGQPRMTGGWTMLNNGLELLPVLIGLFAVSQIIKDVISIDDTVDPLSPSSSGIFLAPVDWLRHGGNLIRSSIIGTWIGILPGIGANIGSAVAYSAARGLSAEPEKFGYGSEEGIVASEAANNATVGGALIPLIAMGIPGSVIDAILLGALVIHNLQPGPLLFSTNPDIVYVIIATMLIANCAMFVIMLLLTGQVAKLVLVPRWLLIPIILVFCVLGSYALDNRMFDVWVMLGFGLVGFGMERVKIPLAPLVIGFVLAPTAERSLGAALQKSGGSFAPMLDPRGLAFYLFVVAVGLFIWPMLRRSHS